MSDPIRVMIVDDEPPVIEGLAATIERQLSGFVVVGSARNGREAIEKARTLQPDVILLDVQMPGIDGIEALRTMRDQGVHSLAILVTAYERFDVARRGYGLGVRDYLVKPVGPRVIQEVLARAEQEIRHERERESHVIEMTEGKTRMLRTLERALLHLILAGVSDSSAVAEMIAQLGLDRTTVVPLVIRFHATDASLITELADRLHYTVHGLVGKLAADRIVVIALHGSESAHQVRERIERSLAFAAHTTEFTIRAGDPVPLHDAGRAISTLTETAGSAPDVRLYQIRASIVRAVRMGDRESATAALDEYLLMAESSGVVSEALEALLVLIADATASNRGPVVDRAIETILASRKLHDTASQIDAARRHIATWVETNSKADVLTPVVRAAVEMTRSEFSRDISLAEIAARLQVSSSHLSRLFSAEVGQPLSAYLTDLRVRHACELLETQRLSVKEVAARCGYRDPNYFSRAFRAATGSTPSEYAHARRHRVEM